MMILVYLAAIVAANLSSANFGPAASVVNAFLLIGLSITSRDSLHELWKGRSLWPKMAALITLGGAISYLLNRGAGQIALASCVAFAAAGTADTIVYHLMGDRSRMLRINGSNLASSALDSILFPTIAFGSLMPAIVIGQFAAKVFGGGLWALILTRGKACHARV